MSDDPLPPMQQSCLDSWRKLLPDYEIRLWDFKRFPKDKSLWVSQAFDTKKYAFAADYIRAYALYNFGGIYLDSDVEVRKSFNDLLQLPYFIGYENGTGHPEAAVVGAEARHPLYEALLRRYDSRMFRKADGSLDTIGMPAVILEEAANIGLKIKDADSPNDVKRDKDTMYVLPYDYFSPMDHNNLRVYATERTYAIHRFAASWVSGKMLMKRRIKKIIGPQLSGLAVKIKRLIFGKPANMRQKE